MPERTFSELERENAYLKLRLAQLESDLVDLKAIAQGRPETITENARKYLAIVRKFRDPNAAA